MSAQQTNLFSENVSQNNAIFPKIYIAYIRQPGNAYILMVVQSSYHILYIISVIVLYSYNYVLKVFKMYTAEVINEMKQYLCAHLSG